MKAVWNIVKKDLFRLRWILLLWAVIMAAGMALATIQAGLDKDTYYPFHLAAFTFASVMLPLIGFGLVMGLVHDDPVADADAFWITRPVSAGQLLAAKSLALGVLWLLPVVVTIPWWLSHDYGFNQLSQAARQTLQAQMVVAWLAAPLAVLSANGSRFVMNVLLAATVLLVLALVHGLGNRGGSGPITEGLVQARARIVVSIWLVASGAVVVSQFFGRRTRRSLLVVATALVSGFAVAKWWRWEIDDESARRVETASAAAPGVEFRSATLGGDTTDVPGEKIIRVVYGISGLENGTVALAGPVSHRLQWADDTVASTSSAHPTDKLAPAAWAVALGKPIEPSTWSEFRVPAGTYGDRLLRDHSGYSAVVDGEIRRPEIVAEVPLETGRKSVRHGVTVRVGEVFLDSLTGEFQVSLGESEPNFLPNRVRAIFGSHPAAVAPAFYFLVNRADGRSLSGRAARVGETLDVATLRYSHTVLSFSPGKGWKGGAPRDFSTWVKNAILVKVTAFAAGSFRRTVTVSRFEPRSPVVAGSAGVSPASIGVRARGPRSQSE